MLACLIPRDVPSTSGSERLSNWRRRRNCQDRHTSASWSSCRFTWKVRGPIFKVTELGRRAGVAGHEGDTADWDVGLQEFLRGDDGADGVSVEMVGEVGEGTR